MTPAQQAYADSIPAEHLAAWLCAPERSHQTLAPEPEKKA